MPTPRGPAKGLPNLAASEPRHYTRLGIASNSKGESILFARDASNWRLTIWLPNPVPTPGQEWIYFEPEFGGLPYLEDFDVISNHLQGRKDDTIDLVVMVKSAFSTGKCLYFPALPFSTKQEDWEAYFSKPIDLTAFRQEESWQVRLGLLPKARRSVFIIGSASLGAGAIRCNVDENGQAAGYPFDFGPEWNKTGNHIFEPCVAARQPGSFTFDDGLAASFSTADNHGVVKVMLPKTPLGDAWELTPLPPLLPSMGFPHWLPVTNINTFRRPDTGEPIITYVMSATTDSPLNKAVWVMDNDTLYHSNRGCWWLAVPADQIFPPPWWTPVRALPLEMWTGPTPPAGPAWLWLQLGKRTGDEQPYAIIESRSLEFRNDGAVNRWLAPATYFETSMVASEPHPDVVTARMFLALDKLDPLAPATQTQSLSVATRNSVSAEWSYLSIPVPAPPADQR